MKKIWTNGCFDVLHLGHLRLLEYAKSCGDYLTVGIDSDRRVRQLKGTKRPINNEFFRREMLSGIRWVDNVVVFDSDAELEKLIETHSDQMIIGSDYRDKRVIGSQYSEVVFFDKIDDYSTTNIIKKLSEER
jgi:D-beta-D-heptose 7-phosphate kinase/D-beta-D-heptose 1-phosphate adenosyltransferase